MCIEQEWRRWECPYCGTEHEDPDDIFWTSCGKCERSVFLLVSDGDWREVMRGEEAEDKFSSINILDY